MTPGNEMIPAPTRRMARTSTHPSSDVQLPASAAAASARPGARWSRRRGVVAAFAAFAAVGFVAAYVTPIGAAFADADADAAASTSLYASAVDDAQTLTAEGEAQLAALQRGSYSVYVTPKPTPKPTQSTRTGSTAGSGPAKYTGGGSKSEWMTAAGIKQSDWDYVNYIVKRESGWNPNATNRSSGACGLVQALPCSKVPGNGYNPVDNLKWANKYAKGRYGSWAGAYDFWISHNWW